MLTTSCLSLLFICLAHPADIFSLAVTPTQIFSASGSSSLRIHSTTEADFPIQQSIDNVHPLGCHHVATDAEGTRAASVGFDGEIKIWAFQEGMWVEDVHAKENIKSTYRRSQTAGGCAWESLTAASPIFSTRTGQRDMGHHIVL